MARELPGIISELRRLISNLASQRDEARRNCADLSLLVKSLQEQLELSNKQLEAARREADFLTVSYHAESPDNLIRARRRLQRLIAKIDRCVAMIRDDADIN